MGSGRKAPKTDRPDCLSRRRSSAAEQCELLGGFPRLARRTGHATIVTLSQKERGPIPLSA